MIKKYCYLLLSISSWSEEGSKDRTGGRKPEPGGGLVHPFFSFNSKSITAMRIGMLFLTCCNINARALSASCDSISIPRLIGPGCMIMAPGFAGAIDVAVRA